ncbi:MAG: nucleotidyltransferase domain-containing protein [Cyclobacteriaceae bacterium]|jgi:hypothetical protein|nr:nucleotidyltransferase domain-containing protein [Cyclobacteriaceae bacterium]
MEKITRKAALKSAMDALAEMRKLGYSPSKAVLFGSFAKGTQRPHSDIDLAIWDARFTGSLSLDSPGLFSVKMKFPRIEFHTYHTSHTIENDPFIEEILQTGINLE